MRKPTIRRLKQSITDARYSHPSQLGKYVMSAHHSRLGACGLTSGSTRSGAQRTPATRTVVRALRGTGDPFESRVGHQPLHALLAHPGAVLQTQLGVAAGRAVGAARGGVDRLDPVDQDSSYSCRSDGGRRSQA